MHKGLRVLLASTAALVSVPAFAWLAAELAAYYQLVKGLCELARIQKRVSASEQQVENEKYAFRCFLLRLGFIGQDYKDSRRVLLKNLSGNAAFRDAREAGDEA